MLHSTSLYPLTSHTRARDQFARDAVFAAFGRDGRAIDWPGFQDRLPHEQPERIDAIAARIAARLSSCRRRERRQPPRTQRVARTRTANASI